MGHSEGTRMAGVSAIQFATFMPPSSWPGNQHGTLLTYLEFLLLNFAM